MLNNAMIPKYTLADIKRHFTQKTFERAQGIVANNEVLSLEWLEEDGTLMGFVSGSANMPYTTDIDIDEYGFECYCSCPVGENCKHAAACLLDFLVENANSHWPIKADDSENSINAWVGRLAIYESGLTQSRQKHVDSGSEGLIYRLYPMSNNAGMAQGIELRLSESSSLINSTRVTEKPIKFDNYGYSHSNSGTKEDSALLDLLRSMCIQSDRPRHVMFAPPYLLQGHLGAALLLQIMLTQRLFVGNKHDSALSQGEPRELLVAWERRGSDNDYSLCLNVEGLGKCDIAFTNPPWYLYQDGNIAGPLLTDIDSELLPILFEAPAVPRESALELANHLHVTFPDSIVPLPVEPTVSVLEETLVPELYVRSVDGSPNMDYWVVSCLMRYGEHTLPFEMRSMPEMSRVDEGGAQEVLIRRQSDREYEFYVTFQRMLSDFAPCHARNPALYLLTDHQPVTRDPLARLEAFERFFKQRERLEAAGFNVIIEPPVSVEMTPVSRLSASLLSDSNDWFELGLRLEHEGVHYELMPLLVKWLEQKNDDQPLRFQAEDGTWLEAPETLIQPVVETLSELLDDDWSSNDILTLPRARALSLAHLRDELDDAGVDTQWQDNSRLFELADKLQRFGSRADGLMTQSTQPTLFQGQLRDYQCVGMAWLNFIADVELNGILADDMGLGKTAQTLAHIQSLVDLTARRHKKNRNGPFLVVAPRSLLSNWAREVQQFTPKLTVRVWHGSDRHLQPLGIEPADIVVTSYALALRDRELLDEQGFFMLILDEAQTIKNPKSKITQALKSMPIKRRLCLTGTPMENHLGELWSLFDFLMPGILGSQKRFSRHFRTPIEVHGNEERQARLNSVVQPFMLRRRKEDVAKELPSKTEIVHTIELGDSQAKLYEGIRLAMQTRVKKLLENRGLAGSHIVMLDALLKMRQTCCHPQLVKATTARKVKDSAKTEHLMQMLEELLAEGRKILLFSQFTEMLSILESEIDKQGIPYVKLTGRTRRRDVVIDAFQSGKVPLFLISLKAGGTGLNLTAADTVIHYDPWWNPAVEKQATDRAHRIGQDKPVFVYKLVAKGTVEEKIVAMQTRKQALSDATVEKKSGEALSALSVDDMLSLFDSD